MSQFAVPDGDCTNPLRLQTGFPHALILNLDEGSSGFAMSWFTSFKLKLRFAFIRDPFHREWNDVKGALSDNGVWWCVLLSSMLFNLPFGPWEGGAWWQKSCGAAEAYVARATFASPVFSALYDSICWDQKIKPTGSAEHRRATIRFAEPL